MGKIRDQQIQVDESKDHQDRMESKPTLHSMAGWESKNKYLITRKLDRQEDNWPKLEVVFNKEWASKNRESQLEYLISKEAKRTWDK